MLALRLDLFAVDRVNVAPRRRRLRVTEHALDDRDLHFVRSKECGQTVPQVRPTEASGFILDDHAGYYGRRP